ncbi:hypothetical protein [Roseinatronobacter bogoriensis]|uniref:hypothetical protein n=1 Tax=Roseinatronobacter bogoriensis TaxID=119542 RepID=UPI0018E229CD|nr:hypothetical protein [Rhodobaca barguzinensis]
MSKPSTLSAHIVWQGTHNRAERSWQSPQCTGPGFGALREHLIEFPVTIAPKSGERP